MADGPSYNPSVALGTTAPDPNQGLNTLGKIMDLGRAGLSIQEQKQAIQSNAQKLQQGAIQTQAAQDSTDFFKNWNPGEHHDETGILDLNSAHQSPAYQALSGAGRLNVDTQLNALQGQQLGNKKALLGVNSDVVSQLGKVAQAASQDPKNAPALFDAFAKQGPDNARAAGIYVPLLSKANWNPDALRTVAAQSQDVSGQQSQTNAGSANTGAGLVNRNNRTGAISAPPGGAPGTAINPTPTQVAGATKRTIEGAGSDFDRANQVSASVAPANQTITITKEIDDLADQVHSGKISAAISKAAAGAGLSADTYARQLLEKDLGRLKATASSGAGSDQRQANILAGFPDATSDNQTIHTAMDYTRGAARQDLARGSLLNAVKSKDESLRGFQHADDLLTSQTDPLMHEFGALKSPADQAAFYKRNFSTREQAQEFRDKVAGMGHVFGQ